jgi:branched-chain amino acid transport system permease protein
MGSALLPALVPGIPSAYKDVFAVAVVIILMAWKPTGLLAEKTSERV